MSAKIWYVPPRQPRWSYTRQYNARCMRTAVARPRERRRRSIASPLEMHLGDSTPFPSLGSTIGDGGTQPSIPILSSNSHSRVWISDSVSILILVFRLSHFDHLALESEFRFSLDFWTKSHFHSRPQSFAWLHDSCGAVPCEIETSVSLLQRDDCLTVLPAVVVRRSVTVLLS